MDLREEGGYFEDEILLHSGGSVNASLKEIFTPFFG